MAPLQTKASGFSPEDQETRASVRQTHATSKITMRQWPKLPGQTWGMLTLKCAVGDCITNSLQSERPTSKMQEDEKGWAKLKIIRSGFFRTVGWLCVIKKKGHKELFPCNWSLKRQRRECISERSLTCAHYQVCRCRTTRGLNITIRNTSSKEQNNIALSMEWLKNLQLNKEKYRKSLQSVSNLIRHGVVTWCISLKTPKLLYVHL